MEAIILATRLALRRAWRWLLAFLDRHKLSDMPPVKTIAIFLAIGLVVPLAMGIDRTPASLSRSLANQRLERLPRGGYPDTSPKDISWCTTPAFFWKAHPQAASYRLRLFSGDAVIHSPKQAYRVPSHGGLSVTVTQARYLLPSPGELAVEREYRFTVEAYDESGKTLGEVTNTTFSIREPSKELKKMRDDALRELEPAAAAYVMAGVYVSHGSTHDVLSALARYVSLVDNEEETELARSILGR